MAKSFSTSKMRRLYENSANVGSSALPGWAADTSL